MADFLTALAARFGMVQPKGLTRSSREEPNGSYTNDIRLEDGKGHGLSLKSLLEQAGADTSPLGLTLSESDFLKQSSENVKVTPSGDNGYVVEVKDDEHHKLTLLNVINKGNWFGDNQQLVSSFSIDTQSNKVQARQQQVFQGGLGGEDPVYDSQSGQSPSPSSEPNSSSHNEGVKAQGFDTSQFLNDLNSDENPHKTHEKKDKPHKQDVSQSPIDWKNL